MIVASSGFSAGGITPTNNLWKYVTVSPGDIELNSGTGVQGINTAMPSDNRFNYQFNNTGATSQAWYTYVSGAIAAVYGMIKSAGTLLISLAVENTVTGHIAQVDVNSLFQVLIQVTNATTGRSSITETTSQHIESIVNDVTTGDILDKELLPLKERTDINSVNGASYIEQTDVQHSQSLSNVGNDYSLRTQNVGQIDETLEFIAGTQKLESIKTPTRVTNDIWIGGAVIIREEINSARWHITNGLGADQFAILNDGKIQTNQIAAGVHAVPNGKFLELFNTAGVSQGFVQLFT